jgi:hypothetical protein
MRTREGAMARVGDGRWAAGVEAAELDDVVGLGSEDVDPNEMTVRPE